MEEEEIGQAASWCPAVHRFLTTLIFNVEIVMTHFKSSENSMTWSKTYSAMLFVRSIFLAAGWSILVASPTKEQAKGECPRSMTHVVIRAIRVGIRQLIIDIFYLI